MTPSRQKTLAATAAVAIGNSIFGFSFMFSRMALRVATPFVMLAFRFVIAFALILLVALWARKSGRQDFLRFQLRGKPIGKLVLLGLIQPVIYFICESYGVSMTNSTVSGVIIAVIPIVALAAGYVFMGEKPSVKQVLFSLLSIAGVIVMTLQQSAAGTIRPLGIVLLLGAVASAAAFNLLSRRLSTVFSPLERTYIMMLMAAICFTVPALIECGGNPLLLLAPARDAQFLLSMLYLSSLSSIFAFFCINFAATVLPVSKSTAFCNLTTILSVFAGVVFLKEKVTIVSVIAALVIIIGVFGVQKE